MTQSSEQQTPEQRINGILKMEYLLIKPSHLEQARKLVEESIPLYNEKRPHYSYILPIKLYSIMLKQR